MPLGGISHDDRGLVIRSIKVHFTKFAPPPCVSIGGARASVETEWGLLPQAGGLGITRCQYAAFELLTFYHHWEAKREYHLNILATGNLNIRQITKFITLCCTPSPYLQILHVQTFNSNSPNSVTTRWRGGLVGRHRHWLRLEQWQRTCLSKTSHERRGEVYSGITDRWSGCRRRTPRKGWTREWMKQSCATKNC